jgi:MFS transporter, PPP family, 3-phenylpropionic acid transporter
MSIARIARSPAGLGATLAAFYFVSFGALGLYAPYFPLWLDSHGFTGAGMGFIAALSPAMSFFGPPLVGLLSDARGARGNLLSLACALAAAGMAVLCVCEFFGLSASFGLVFASVLAYAACRSPLVLLADRLTIEHGENYGRRRVWGSVGYMLAAAGFGHWCLPGALRWLPGLVALVLVLAFATSLWLPRSGSVPVAPALGGARRLLTRPGFVPFLVGAAISAASHSSYDLCAPLFFRDIGASGNDIGLLYGTAVFAEVVLLATGGGLLERQRPEVALGVAYAGAAFRWLCLSWISSTPLAFLLQPLHAVSFGLMWMASLAYVRRVAEPHTLGSAQGAFMAANAAGGVLGMLAWGPLYASHGGAFVFRMAAALSCGSTCLVSLGLVRQARGAKASALAAPP